GDTIISIQLYYNARIGANVDYAAPFADFYVDLDDTTNYAAENAKTHVLEIDPSEYWVHPNEHWIMFKYPNGGISDNLLGYFMIVKRINGTIDTLGQATEEPYSLKLIKHPSPVSTFVTWNYEWRNVYSMPRNIDLDSLEINIYKGGVGTDGSNENLDHQNGVKYIQVLGLDRYDRNGAETPDGLVDIYRPYIYDRSQGLLIFPHRKPFATDYSFGDAPVLESQVPEIYDHKYGTTDVCQSSKYYIKVNYVDYGYLK
ncbi:MAG: hypothetical protein GY865_08870, partial [candidate division Zixibacteria bacterium]|nr:hypothetical protein [candidate division Zixibacteria bacterium]